jgi:hypothetical protein
MLKVGDRSPIKLIPVAQDEFRAGDFGDLVFNRTPGHQSAIMTLFSQAARGVVFAKKN